MAELNVQNISETQLPRRVPLNGTFELTLRCNLHCKMCLFRHDDCENQQLMANELTTEQWISIAQQAADAGTFYLLLTGGEPMLRPDFCRLYEEIYQLGFIITLYTNATLVTPKIMETLRRHPPHKIGITIYGASSDTYERTCGSARAFEQMRSGVKQLLTLPSEFEFRTTIIKDNFCDWKAIDTLVAEEFGHPITQASPINKAVRGACAKVEECRLPPRQDEQMKYERSMDAIRKVVGKDFKEENVKVHIENPAVPSGKKTPSLFGCQAGISQYTVTYDGKLLACQMLDVFHTDALENGLQAAWDAYPNQVRIRIGENKCASCPYVKACRSCFASRYAETGDFTGCSEYLFQSAKARMRLLEIGGIDNEKCSV